MFSGRDRLKRCWRRARTPPPRVGGGLGLLLLVRDEMRDDPAAGAAGCVMRKDEALTNPAVRYLELYFFYLFLLEVAGELKMAVLRRRSCNVVC